MRSKDPSVCDPRARADAPGSSLAAGAGRTLSCGAPPVGGPVLVCGFGDVNRGPDEVSFELLLCIRGPLLRLTGCRLPFTDGGAGLLAPRAKLRRVLHALGDRLVRVPLRSRQLGDL